MRIYLDKSAKYGPFVHVCIIGLILITVTSIACYFKIDDALDLMWLFVPAMVMCGIVFGGIVFVRRLYAYVIANESMFCGYSFYHKKKCTVYRGKPVYYAVFETTLGGTSRKLVALSNEPFEYRVASKHGVKFVQSYDIKKIVVLPYNESTKPLLNLEQWNNVNHVVTSPFEMDVWPYLMIGIPSVGGFAVLNFGEIFFVVLFVLSAIFLWKNESKKFAQYYKSKYPMEYLRMCEQKCYKAQLEFKPTAQDEILERNQKQFKTMLRYEILAPICFVICIIAKLFAL